MKLHVSILFCLLVSVAAISQEKPSPEAEALFKKAMSEINPRHVKWIQSTAADVNQVQLGPASVISKSNTYGVLGGMNGADIEAIAFLVLMQASKSAQEDLKAIMASVKSINEQKAALREMMAKLQQQQKTTPQAVLDSFKFLQSKTLTLHKKQNPDTVKFARTRITAKEFSKSELDAMIDQIKKDIDSMSEMGEMESLRLQMAMDRMSKMMSTLSNILKKISKTSETITQNLK